MDFIGSGGNSSNITESDSNKTMLVGSRNITYRNRNHTVQVATLGDMEAIPEPYQSCLTGLYIGTAVVAIVANVLALTILITKKRSSADLRKYLINLAISDMSMAAFSLPFAYSDMMYGYWQFPLFWCPISHFISTCSVCVSIFTLTGIGIERYMAIVYPLKYCWWCESHTYYILFFIWSLSLVISMPLLFVARTVPFTDLIDGQLYYDCREEWEGQLSSMIYSGVLFVVTFIVPFIALTFLYGSIGVKTFRHIQPGEAHTNRDRAQQRIKIKVIKMLVTLVTVFLICWAPLQIYNLVIWIFQDLRNPTSKLHEYLFYGLFFASHLLSQFHTFLNPFIYCYMSNNFSVADLRSILDKRLPKSCYEKPVQRRSSFEFRARTGTPSTTKTQFSINNSVL